MNYVIGHAMPPRFNAAARLIRVDVDASEIAASPRRLDLGIVAEARSFLEQATESVRGRVAPDAFAAWCERLRGRNDGKVAEQEAALGSDRCRSTCSNCAASSATSCRVTPSLRRLTGDSELRPWPRAC